MKPFSDTSLSVLRNLSFVILCVLIVTPAWAITWPGAPAGEVEGGKIGKWADDSRTIMAPDATGTAIGVGAGIITDTAGVKTATISGDLMLDVAGKVGATEYCDADGNSCFGAATVASLVAGGAVATSVVTSADPSTNFTGANVGDVAYDTTGNELQVFDGVAWVGVNTDTQLSDADIAALGYVKTDTDTQLTDAEIAALGYIKVDTDTQLSDADIAALGYIKVDADTQLTESEVDSFVSNNGYLTAESQDIAFDGSNLSITGGSSVDLTALSGGGKFVDGDTTVDAVFSGGNVGIGTTSPDNMLTIESNSTTRPNLHLKNTSGDNRSAFLSFSGTSGGETSTYNIFQWSAGQVLHFDVNDNGTSKNLFRLYKDDQSASFYGDVSTPGDVSANAFIGDGSQLTNLPAGGKFTDGTNTADAVFTGGNVGIGTTAPFWPLEVHTGSGLRVRFSDDSTNNIDFFPTTGQVSTGGDILLRAFGDSGSVVFGAGTAAPEHMRIDGTTGNVGIGTTSPGKKLHVEDSSITGDGDIAHLLAPSAADDSYLTMKFGKSTATGGAGILGIHHNVGSPADSYMWFSVQGDSGDNGAGLVVRKGGNVGIGTSTPSEKLDVAGNVKATAFIGDGSQLTNLPAGGKFVDGTNTADAVYTGGGVGIGVLNPQELLQVGSMTFRQGAFGNMMSSNLSYSGTGSEWTHINDGGASQIRMEENISFFSTGSQASGDNSSLSPADTKMIIKSNGNVGIGTTDPGYKFDVAGNIGFGNVGRFMTGANVLKAEATGANGVLLRSAISNEANPSYSSVDDTDTGMFTPGSDVLGFTTAGAEAVRIDANGNVGIGTNSPTEKLEVNGNILATGTITPSDRSLKQNIQPLTGALENVAAITGATYEWKDGRVAGSQLGVIAQEVETVYPQAVHTLSDGTKAVNYQSLVAPLIEAVKELKAQNEALEARLEALEQ